MFIPLTYEVRNDNPVSGSDERRNHLPVEEGPGWLSVEAEHDGSIFRALVQIVHPWKGHPTTCLHLSKRWLLGTYIDAVVVGGERIAEFLQASKP